MFTKDSTGVDWFAASPEMRSHYIVTACRGCPERGVGNASPALVVEGMDAFFAVPSLRRHKVSFAFEMVHTALVKLGDYHPLVERFRAGEQESPSS